MELKLQFDDVDYEAAAETLAPLLLEQLRREGGNPMLARMFSGSPDMASSAAKSVLGHMSKQRRDEMLVRFINQNREAFAKAIMDFAAQKNLRFRITDVEAKR